MNIALFASHNGSVLEPLLQAGFDILFIMTNNTNAPVIQKASANAIDCEVINERLYPGRVTQRILERLEEHEIDLIVLAGYMKMLPSELIERYKRRIINTHPSLLPKFGGEGMYGRYVHEAVIAAGEKRSGITVHFVEEEYDSGEIILQKSIAINPSWDAQALETAVKQIEPDVLIEALQRLDDDRS